MFASYLESAELELQIFLLVEELLESVGQDDVRVVQSAVLLVELVVLVILHASTAGHAIFSHHLLRGSLAAHHGLLLVRCHLSGLLLILRSAQR